MTDISYPESEPGKAVDVFYFSSMAGKSSVSEKFYWPSDSAFSDLVNSGLSGDLLLITIESSSLTGMAEKQVSLFELLGIEELNQAASVCSYVDEFEQLKRGEERAGRLVSDFFFSGSRDRERFLLHDASESVGGGDLLVELGDFEVEVADILAASKSAEAEPVLLGGAVTKMINFSSVPQYADSFDKSIPYFTLLAFSGGSDDLEYLKEIGRAHV